LHSPHSKTTPQVTLPAAWFFLKVILFISTTKFLHLYNQYCLPVTQISLTSLNLCHLIAYQPRHQHIPVLVVDRLVIIPLDQPDVVACDPQGNHDTDWHPAYGFELQ